jgi:hypothetical protein
VAKKKKPLRLKRLLLKLLAKPQSKLAKPQSKLAKLLKKLLHPLLTLLLLLAKQQPPLAKLLTLPLKLPSNSGSRNEKPAFWPVFLRP